MLASLEFLVRNLGRSFRCDFHLGSLDVRPAKSVPQVGRGARTSEDGDHEATDQKGKSLIRLHRTRFRLTVGFLARTTARLFELTG